ncbi:AraC family transcriptional regulator [Clostridium sp. DL1XJH146]
MKNKFAIVYKNELVKFEHSLPSKLYIGDVQKNIFHCHKEVELIYCLQGGLQLETERGNFLLDTKDIILLNPNTVHKFVKTHENNILITLQISLEKYKKYIPDINSIAFYCNSIDDDRHKYDELIELLKQYIVVLDDNEKSYLLKLKIVIDKIVDLLYNNFQYKKLDKDKLKDSNRNLVRINEIFDYVHMNYKEGIKLEQIADELHLSSYYLMHFFKKKTGVTILEYITTIRLQNAYEDLVGTNKTILDIAIDNGFASSKAFTKSFKETYSMTPFKYRKAVEEKVMIKGNYDKNIVEDSNMDIHSIRKMISKI